MKQIAMLVVLGASFLSLTKLAVQSSLPTVATTQARPDARRVKTGHFTYRSIDHGKNVGKGEITIRKLADSGNYAFSDDFVFSAEFKGFRSQRWESIATSEFEPVSAMLSFVQGDRYAPVFDLKYGPGSRVTGFAIARKDSKAGTRRTVDAAVPKNTVDQRIDWAAVLASDLEKEKQFEFNVYDPNTGVSRVHAQVGSVERVEVPAGSFDVYRVIYRIEKAGGTEQYQVLASRVAPRTLVREEFPDGSFDELLEIRE